MKRTAVIRGIALVCILGIPVLLLLLSSMTRRPALPTDCGTCDYFAMTDALGEEYVFPAGDPFFSAAAQAFCQAVPSTRDGRDQGGLLLEWIRDGYATAYRLRFAPEEGQAYVTDTAGQTFLLDDAGAYLFYSSAAAAPSLTGEAAPALELSGASLLPSMTQWCWKVPDGQGGEATCCSFEMRQETEGDLPCLPLGAVQPLPEEAGVAVTYRVYQGETLLYSGPSCPAPALFERGTYQVILLLTAETGRCTVRAAYTFLVSP